MVQAVFSLGRLFKRSPPLHTVPWVEVCIANDRSSTSQLSPWGARPSQRPLARSVHCQGGGCRSKRGVTSRLNNYAGLYAHLPFSGGDLMGTWVGCPRGKCDTGPGSPGHQRLPISAQRTQAFFQTKMFSLSPSPEWWNHQQKSTLGRATKGKGRA